MGDTTPNSDDLAGSCERVRFLNREAAKVYLLLDFLSGRADRSLRPTPEEQARSVIDEQNRAKLPGAGDEEQRAEIEADLCDPTRLVLRAMRISNSIKPADETFHADAAFLMRARDMLNARAWPATGATIAFTSMAFAQSPTGRHNTENMAEVAERAYPEFRQSAQSLAGSIAWTLRGLLGFLVIALGVSAYTAWGKVMMDTLDAVRRDAGAAQAAQANAVWGKVMIDALDARRDAGATKPTQVADLKSDTAKSDVVPRDTTSELDDRFAVTLHQISTWESPIRFVSLTLTQVRERHEQMRTAQWATAMLTVLGNYIMPILYGLLGSIAYVLRRYHDRLAGHLLSPRDLRANSIRLALGVMIGGCIGLVYSGSSAAQTAGILGAAATLSTAAIAFLAGYGVEGVFKALDSLITQVFRVNGTEKPPHAAA